MALWRPDPTFYPSPKMAMQAPPEKLAFVAMLNGSDNGRHDALGVVDVDPGSTGYGRIVGQELRAAIQLPFAKHIEAVVIHHEDAAGTVAGSVPERAGVDSFRTAVNGMR